MGTFDRTRVLSIWAFLPDEHYSLIDGTFSSDDGKENVRNICSNEQNTGSSHAIHTLVYFFAVLCKTTK